MTASYISPNQQFVVAFIAGLSLFCGGAAFTWLTPLVPRLQSPTSVIPLSADDVSWILAMFEIGTMITPIPTGWAANRWGRKSLLWAFGPTMALTWIVLIVSPTKLTLYILRAVQGMLTSIPYTVLPLYLAEISDPKFRGAVSSFFNLMWHLGMLFVYVTGTFFSYRALIYAMLAPTVLFTVAFFWCPESPYFLVMKKRTESALKALALLNGCRRNSEGIDLKLKSIEDSVEADKKSTDGSWRDLLLKRKGLKALFLSQLVTVTYIMTGAATMEEYVTDTITGISNREWVANVVSIILGVLLVIAVIPAFFLVDVLGRRPLLLISTGGCSLCLLLGSTVLFLSEEGYGGDFLRDISYVASILSMCVVTFGIEPVVPILQSELCSTSTRGIVSGISTFSIGIVATFSVKLYQYVQLNFGVGAVYLVYFCFSLSGCIAIHVFVPETKMKTFEEIQRAL